MYGKEVLIIDPEKHMWWCCEIAKSDYESPALTTAPRARCNIASTRSKCPIIYGFFLSNNKFRKLCVRI